MNKIIDWLALIVLVVGGLNWGLVGLFGYNLVDSLFGMGSSMSMIVYDLVGLSALYVLITRMMDKDCCVK